MGTTGLSICSKCIATLFLLGVLLYVSGGGGGITGAHHNYLLPDDDDTNSTSRSQNNNTFELVLLTEAAKSKGAVCLDGSPGGYYIRRPLIDTNSRKFLIFHEGGGWCKSDANCLDRSHNRLGSSTSYEATIPADHGLEAVALYAYLQDYTIVYAKYCDGTSWSSNVEEPIQVFNETTRKNETIYYRGRRLLDALIEDLVQTQGLDDADVLLYAGCSAGSLTAYLHIDYIRTKLSPKTKLAGLGDSMFALPYRSFNGSITHLQQMLQWGYMAWNSSSSINDRCREHYASDRKHAYLCLFGAVVVNFVQTPMLVVNSKFDTWQRKAIMGFDDDHCSPRVDTDGTVIPCGNDSPAAQARDKYWKIFASVMERSVEEVLPSHHGAFLTNCPWHCLFSWMNWYDSAGPNERLNDATAHWVDLLETGRINDNMTAPKWIAKEQDKCLR